MPAHAALSVLQFYILDRLVSDQKEYLKLVQQLTGPRLTTMERQKLDADRPADEPPMPSWWDEDEETLEEQTQKAKQINAHLM